MRGQRDQLERKWFLYGAICVVMPFWFGMLGIAFWNTDDQPLSYIFIGTLVMLMVWLIINLWSLLLIADEIGVSMLTLQGRRLVVWKDITYYSEIPPMLIFSVVNKRYVLDLTFLKNPARLVDYFEQYKVEKR